MLINSRLIVNITWKGFRCCNCTSKTVSITYYCVSVTYIMLCTSGILLCTTSDIYWCEPCKCVYTCVCVCVSFLLLSFKLGCLNVYSDKFSGKPPYSPTRSAMIICPRSSLGQSVGSITTGRIIPDVSTLSTLNFTSCLCDMISLSDIVCVVCLHTHG